MRCPFCKFEDTKVLDSRLTPDFASIRRRRECQECEKRFTTYERMETEELSIVKRDGRREPFSREKLLKGVLRACEKRPVKREHMENIVALVENAIRANSKNELRTSKVGEIVMNELGKIDDVAYVRFASVYRKFRHADQFVDAIKHLRKMETVPNATAGLR
ncbi:transcriptional repressor NrdR [Candidatus Woesearchaeota archaeon]|nr:MAG: transcriptional repressor NrdR [Candidatus Woesearchaeota archaeon]